MGSSTPAKYFANPSVFGKSPNNVVTQTQDTPTIQGPGFAALSGYDQTQISAPDTSPQDGPAQDFGGGDVEQLRKRIQDQRMGAMALPFFG